MGKTLAFLMFVVAAILGYFCHDAPAYDPVGGCKDNIIRKLGDMLQSFRSHSPQSQQMGVEHGASPSANVNQPSATPEPSADKHRNQKKAHSSRFLIKIPGSWVYSSGLEMDQMRESHFNDIPSPIGSVRREISGAGRHMRVDILTAGTTSLDSKYKYKPKSKQEVTVEIPPDFASSFFTAEEFRQAATKAIKDTVFDPIEEASLRRNAGVPLQQLANTGDVEEASIACSESGNRRVLSNFNERAHLHYPSRSFKTRGDMLNIDVYRQRDGNLLVAKQEDQKASDAFLTFKCGPFVASEYLVKTIREHINKNLDGELDPELDEIVVELEDPYVGGRVTPHDATITMQTPSGTSTVAGSSRADKAKIEDDPRFHKDPGDVQEDALRRNTADLRNFMNSTLSGLGRHEFVPLFGIRLVNDRFIDDEETVFSWVKKNLRCKPLPCLSVGGLDFEYPLGLLEKYGPLRNFFRLEGKPTSSSGGSSGVLYFGFPPEVIESPDFQLYSFDEQRALRQQLGLDVLDGVRGEDHFLDILKTMAPTGFDVETGKTLYDHSSLIDLGALPVAFSRLGDGSIALLKEKNPKLTKVYELSLQVDLLDTNVPTFRFQEKYHHPQGVEYGIENHGWLASPEHVYMSKGFGLRLTMGPSPMPTARFAFKDSPRALSPPGTPVSVPWSHLVSDQETELPRPVVDTTDIGLKEYLVEVKMPVVEVPDNRAGGVVEEGKSMTQVWKILPGAEGTTSLDGATLFCAKFATTKNMCWQVPGASKKVSFFNKLTRNLFRVQFPLFHPKDHQSTVLEIRKAQTAGGFQHYYMQFGAGVLESGEVGEMQTDVVINLIETE